MNRYLAKILITLMLAVVSISAANAQNDTLSGLYLFNNAVSNDDLSNDSISQNSAKQDVDTVAENLNNLKALYAKGKYGLVLVLARDIHNQGNLTKKQNLERLKYNIAAFKELAYHREADSTARLFYKKDPFYDPTETDPLPFREVLANYYTMPIIGVWASLGVGTANVYEDTIRSIVDTLFGNPFYRALSSSVQIGIEYRPIKFLSISIAPTYSTYTIERTIDRSSSVVFHYNENATVFSLPICVELGLYKRNEIFVPSIFGGAQLKYIYDSKYNAYNEIKNSYFTDTPAKKSDVSTKNRINTSVLGGIKFNVNIRRITYFAEGGVSYDIFSYNDPAKIYNNTELLYQNLFVPDVFHMLEFYMRFGVKINLHYNTIAKYKYGY